MNTKSTVPIGVRVAGKMEQTFAEHTRRLGILLREEQEKPLPNNALIAALCDSIRLAREAIATIAAAPAEAPLERCGADVEEVRQAKLAESEWKIPFERLHEIHKRMGDNAIDEEEIEAVLLAAFPVSRLSEALDAFYKDNHRWSTRPCETCAAITAASGVPFGCDKMAGRVKVEAEKRGIK